jgi:hypothetical protein
MEGKTEHGKSNLAFHRARLLACNSSCERCGQFRKFPDGVALFEEPFCESVWLCEECFPDSTEEDEGELSRRDQGLFKNPRGPVSQLQQSDITDKAFKRLEVRLD